MQLLNGLPFNVSLADQFVFRTFCIEIKTVLAVLYFVCLFLFYVCFLCTRTVNCWRLEFLLPKNCGKYVFICFKLFVIFRLKDRD